jgi:hypothetical protein
MKYVEASQFGGPEVLRVVEKTTQGPGEGILLVECKLPGSTTQTCLPVRDAIGRPQKCRLR